MSVEVLKGVWRREFEEDPLGDSENADRETLVLWSQTPRSGIYVDLRLPKGSQGRQRGNLSSDGRDPSQLLARGIDAKNLSSDDVEIILKQKSFAGRLQYSVGDTTSGQALEKDSILSELSKGAESREGALSLCTCFWKREIDFQPPSGGLDIGVCASAPPNPDGSIDLRETGDDASYAEGWHRLVGSNEPPYLASQLVSENGLERLGYWVRTGKFFAYAVGRPQDSKSAIPMNLTKSSSEIGKCVGKSLKEAVMGISTEKNDQLEIVGTYVAVYGEISKEGEWEIEYSTHPALVGCQLVGTTRTSCSILRRINSQGKAIQDGDNFEQQVGSSCVRKWKVIELDGPVNLPGLTSN